MGEPIARRNDEVVPEFFCRGCHSEKRLFMILHPGLMAPGAPSAIHTAENIHHVGMERLSEPMEMIPLHHIPLVQAFVYEQIPELSDD